MATLGAVGALAVSVLALLLSFYNSQRSAKKDYTQQVEARVTKIEGELESCLREREGLERERVQLLERLAQR